MACAVVLTVLMILLRQSWRSLAGWKWLNCANAGALLNAIGLRLRTGQWLGLALGVAGVALVVGEAALESAARFQGLVWANGFRPSHAQPVVRDANP
jgi:hypothetical protein